MSRHLRLASLAAVVVAIGCGGGTTAEPAPAVASVTVTVPAAPPTLAAVGRTVQFTAQARAANNDLLTTEVISWSSSSPGVASVTGSGLVTAVANGTTEIRASAGGVQSAPMIVTVSQVAASVLITPNPVAIVGIGSFVQLVATERDSNNTTIPGSPTITWTRLGPGTHASVSASGLVTALGVGNSDSARASIGSKAAIAPISVTATEVIPTSAAVNIGDFFFRSVRNNTQNRAIDTVAVGGTVTWTYTGSANHNVNSIGTPTFTSSALKSTGIYEFTFTNPGTYEYTCQLHESMTGRVVVR